MSSKGEIEMDEHMKAMWAGQSNVLVAVRVRPLMKHDVIKKSCVRVLDTNVVVIVDPATGDKQDILRANRNREKQYAFDYVFEPKSSQETTYLHTAKFLIHGILDGFNATVFAYGQTGSGKTHTMIGSEAEPGIMVRVMDDLFRASAKEGKVQGVQYKMSVSFLEVYNENIRDLLSDAEEYLDLREDPIKGPVVASITEIEATSSQEIMSLLHQGNAKRSQAATAANEVSSRSHAVLQVVVENRDRAPGTVANIKVGKLSLVDLAGSERAANTKNVGARLVEGANINRSLLALGNCINALGEKGNKGNFVPYRDSKLTRLLKDSLGGNCRTVMIANISAAESSFEETLNTLKYANRAKNIKTHVQRNVLNVNYHISEYVQLIDNLRGEIQLLKNQIGAGGPALMLDRIATSHADLRSRGGRSPVRAHSPPQAGGVQSGQRSPLMHVAGRGGPSTPFQALRESMRSGAGGEGRELVNNMRQRIVENFQERMQLRRSLIELEDQNVQNSIEVSKRQLIVVQWSETHGSVYKQGRGHNAEGLTKADFAADIIANGSGEIVEAWQECEQLRKAIMKNNGMKKNIAKRLRHNEKEAENFRDELGDKITGEDRRELMELQYQVGRLELENMELEQHRIVHESILKGKDLEIQKLKLQLAVRDKLINRQQNVLLENNLDGKVGYTQLALMEQTLMGDAEFATAMVPPSPPRNMSEMALPANTVDSRFNFANVGGGAGIAAAGSGGAAGAAGRRKVVATTNGAAIPPVNGGSGKDKRSGGGAAVPKLKIAGGGSGSGGAANDSDDEEYEYSIPLSERETALTARDRDLIEQGDWSEIHDELSDNDFSLLGKRVGDAHKSVMISSFQSNNNKVGNSGITIAPVGSGAVSSAIQNPRGGRHFRSPQAGAEEPSAPPANQNQQGNAPNRPAQHGFKNHSGGFQIEDSDEDSAHGNPGKGGKKAGNSPRKVVDKLDPIPLPLYDEPGIFSGRRMDNNKAVAPAKKDAGPASGSSSSAVGGYAPIYPSLAGASSKERVDKERDSNNANAKFSHIVGNAAKREEDKDWSEERSRKEGPPLRNVAPPASGLSRYPRRNSKGQLDDEFDAGLPSDAPSFNPNAPSEPALMIGDNGPAIRGGARAGGVGRNAALGRLKAHGPPTGSSSSASINNENNSDFSLNVYGNGLAGGAAVGPSSVAGPAEASRPANKNKSNARKIKQQAPPAGDMEGLSIDGVGSQAQQAAQDDGAYLGGRMRSLPNLSNKQNADGNLSARG